MIGEEKHDSTGNGNQRRHRPGSAGATAGGHSCRSHFRRQRDSPRGRKAHAHFSAEICWMHAGLTGRLRGAARPLHSRNTEEMNAVFADSFYYFALVNPNDPAHAKTTAFTQTYMGR